MYMYCWYSCGPEATYIYVGIAVVLRLATYVYVGIAVVLRLATYVYCWYSCCAEASYVPCMLV